ncbi:hypothetical protein SEA_LILHUDDY_85 [Arthrobacter phage LilHuddy]|nr:hypothetical protein SEA_LILHUDDY_85 [Arthrobacter phage LilHuddy]
MSKILPTAKVTVIVEGMDDIHKIIVPLASRPDFGITDTYDVETGTTADEKWFSFGCYALYDIDQHLVADQKKLTKAQWEDQIIDQARDILRARWQARMVGTQATDTTSINIVRGEE